MSDFFRYPEFAKAMNENFDLDDRETCNVLLAVNEEDQSRVLSALTSKLYDAIVDKVDDIDFGEIPATKGDITKLPSFERMQEAVNTIQKLMFQFHQDTTKNIDQVDTAISNIVKNKDVFVKGYILNLEFPIVMYNTMVMGCVTSLSYMIANCIDFIKQPNTDTFDTVITRTAVIKSNQHLLFTNLRRFNDSCKSGEFNKAMDYVMKADSKQFLGGAMVIGGTVAALGIIMNIIPIMRELIYFYFYNRVRVSDYFALQADLLQMNIYNLDLNRPNITREEKDKIIRKQTTIANAFRKAADSISVDCKQAELKGTKDMVKSTKKFTTSDILDDMPDSAAAERANGSIF